VYARTTIGIDLGIATKHRVVALTADAPDRVMSVRTSPAELDTMLDAVGGPDYVDVVMEPTGLSWAPVSSYLIEKGCCVTLVDTRKAHGLRKVLSRNVKSDQADARALARIRLVTPEDTRAIPQLDGDAFVLARVMKSRESTLDARVQVELRIKSYLQAYLPTLSHRLMGRSLGPVERHLLRHFLDPKATLDVGPEGLLEALEEAGYAPSACTARLAHDWSRAAEDTRALYDARLPFDLIQLHIQAELDIYESFAPRVGRFDELIATLYDRIDPGKIAETLVGIGPIVGATVSAVLGSPETIAARFPNADHLVSYSGFAPKKNQTGKSNREGQHISKAGSRLLRRYFYLAAETARRRDPELAAFYARLMARGKHHTCAVVAVAAKMLRRLYAVCKRAAAGDTTGYVVRDVDGQPLSRRQAAEVVRERHPSKAAQARAHREAKEKKRAERRVAQNTRQSADSSRRSGVLDPAPEYPMAAGRGVPRAVVDNVPVGVDSACARLRS